MSPRVEVTPLRRYRTEILIPPDRTVVLQLPIHIPEGRATIVVQVDEPDRSDVHENDPDRQDIEWWDEFDEDATEEGDVEAR